MKFSVSITFIVMLLAGCKEDTPDVIQLVYPEHESIVEPSGINFQWSTFLYGSFQLTVSDSENFSSPVVDVIVNAKEYVNPTGNSFVPSVRYYWRVRKGGDEATATFMIKDILAEYSDVYNVVINEHGWNALNGVFLDTSYAGTITVLKNNATNVKVTLSGLPSGICKFQSFTVPQKKYFYLDSQWSQGGLFYIMDLADSVYVEFHSGSIGGGITWSAGGKK